MKTIVRYNSPRVFFRQSKEKFVNEEKIFAKFCERKKKKKSFPPQSEISTLLIMINKQPLRTLSTFIDKRGANWFETLVAFEQEPFFNCFRRFTTFFLSNGNVLLCSMQSSIVLTCVYGCPWRLTSFLAPIISLRFPRILQK